MRYIEDEYELPLDDDDGDAGYGLRKPRPRIGGWLLFLLGLVAVSAGLYFTVRVANEQSNDAFCTSCHTVPEQTYFDRAGSASGGALAVDLASFHYQTLRGQGGIIRCIDCHQGTGSLTHRVDVLTVSARHALEWVISRNDNKIEKLYTSAPHLSNDSCLTCHAKSVLVSGMANHWHNMLPSVYELWRAGAPVIPPAGTVDKQAVIAAGLTSYQASLLCSDCHQTHASQNEPGANVPAPVGTATITATVLGAVGAARAQGPGSAIRPMVATHLDVDQYLDKQFNVPERCIQCHREAGKGPLAVIVP